MSYDYGDYEWDRRHDEMVKGLSEEPVRYHLGTVGDAIQARVIRCLDQARQLSAADFTVQLK